MFSKFDQQGAGLGVLLFGQTSGRDIERDRVGGKNTRDQRLAPLGQDRDPNPAIAWREIATDQAFVFKLVHEICYTAAAHQDLLLELAKPQRTLVMQCLQHPEFTAGQTV